MTPARDDCRWNGSGDLDGYLLCAFRHTVTNVVNSNTFHIDHDGRPPTDWVSGGKLVFTSGAMAGVALSIGSANAANKFIQVTGTTPHGAAVGDDLLAIPFCDSFAATSDGLHPPRLRCQWHTADAGRLSRRISGACRMMTRKDFLEAAGLATIAFAERAGLPAAASRWSRDAALDQGAAYPAAVFEKGAAYPAAARVDLADIAVPPGATRVVVPMTLDRPTANTVVAFVRCYDGDGGRAQPDAIKPVIFRPGDPSTQTVTFACHPLAPGQTLKLLQANVPDGGKRGANNKTVTARAGAKVAREVAGRAPLPFEPLGKMHYAATGREVLESGLWLDRLAHGRTQPGNAETGYYHPDAFTLDGDDLLLRSYRLREPAREGDRAHPFAASMLTGLVAKGRSWPRVRPELSFRRGTIEWVARMPNRRGSWPALWLCSVSDMHPQWPFEIDVFEGFYHNPSLKPASSLTANLHGGREGSSQRRWTRPMLFSTMRDFGLPNTLDSAFHRFACRVERDWITIWVDGIETMRWANPFASTQGWYPLMNVGVKAAMDDPYDQDRGDMAIRSVRIWREA